MGIAVFDPKDHSVATFPFLLRLFAATRRDRRARNARISFIPTVAANAHCRVVPYCASERPRACDVTSFVNGAAPMARTAPADSPDPMCAASKQLFRIRMALWMAYGAALGLPVDDLVAAINQQMDVTRTTLGGKRLCWSPAQRLLQVAYLKRIPVRMRQLFCWITTPAALIRTVKRFQQRMANSATDPEAEKGPGRPWLGQEKIDAILRIFDSGCTGLSRIVGEMAKCGLTVVESTVRKVLTQHGRAPTPGNSRKGSTWLQFWKLHAHATVGADFIQIPIGLLGKVVNAFIFIAIEHDTRRVHLLGITCHPTDAWCANVLRSATMSGEPLARRKHWILDNDGKYGQQAKAVLDTKLIQTAIHAPDMNAYAERFIRSIQDECLNHIIFLSEDHLRQATVEYIRHYNDERPHQGIGNVTIGPWQIGTGEIVCNQSLHGMLTSFRRAA